MLTLRTTQVPSTLVFPGKIWKSSFMSTVIGLSSTLIRHENGAFWKKTLFKPEDGALLVPEELEFTLTTQVNK